MAFTATLINQSPTPHGEFMEELYDCVNTAGNTGGVITTRWIKNIQSVLVAPGITYTKTATTVTVTMDINSSGGVQIVGV